MLLLFSLVTTIMFVTGFECKINKQICVAVKAEDSKGSHPCFKKTDVYFRDYSVKPAANGMEITLKMHSYSQILYLGILNRTCRIGFEQLRLFSMRL